MSYVGAGVSVSSGNELVDRIKPMLASTARSGASASIGGFGGFGHKPHMKTFGLRVNTSSRSPLTPQILIDPREDPFPKYQHYPSAGKVQSVGNSEVLF